MNQQLAGKIVFLSGGASGIGKECARAYVREGARVAIADIDEKTARETARELGESAVIAIGCDISQRGSVEQAVQRSLAAFGRIDAVHNNAAISGPSKPLDETGEEEWERVLSTNLKSILHTTTFALPALKAARGCILNTASMVGLNGQENHAAYVASKGGMIALTKAMALDYAAFGIRVNAICPAGVWTPMMREWVAAQPNPAEMVAYLNHVHALGYCPEADVVADAAVFLLSEKARFITGVALPVSGGAELGYRRQG